MTHSVLVFRLVFAADLLLVSDGLRISFVVDVFAPINVWCKLLQQLKEVCQLCCSSGGGFPRPAAVRWPRDDPMHAC